MRISDWSSDVCSSDLPWWQSLGDDGRDEYAAAMDDIQSAKVQSDGSLVTSKRTFRFWAREKEYRPELTRLDWTAPDGQTYAFTYEQDMRLRDLADKIGRAHVGTPVTNAQLVYRLLLEKKKTHTTN